jgi:hypothetical protein
MNYQKSANVKLQWPFLIILFFICLLSPSKQCKSASDHSTPTQDIYAGLGWNSWVGFPILSCGYEKQMFRYQSLDIQGSLGPLREGFPIPYAVVNSIYDLDFSWRYFFHKKNSNRKGLSGFFLAPLVELSDGQYNVPPDANIVDWTHQVSLDQYLFGFGLSGGYQCLVTKHFELTWQVQAKSYLLLGDNYGNNLYFVDQNNIGNAAPTQQVDTMMTLGWAL